jgi:transposase-like protein
LKLKQTYSVEFKEQALLKVLHRGSRTIGSVADELNMNVMTLKNWMKGAAASARSEGSGHARRPEDWSLEERLLASPGPSSSGVILMKYPFPARLRTRRRSNPKNPKASPCSVSFRVVAADSDDDVVGEPVIVHCLRGSLRRLAADLVEHPVDLVQVDIRGERAERATLRDADFACRLDNLLDQV